MFTSATLEPARKKPTKIQAEPSHSASTAPSRSQGTGTCPCGGGCPRCQAASEHSQEFIGGYPSAAAKDESLFGAASTIGENTLNGPVWGNQGAFDWDIGWTTDGTSGFIVQHMEVMIKGTKPDGTAIDNSTRKIDPDFYEVWEVDGAGKVTGNGGKTPGQDFWMLKPAGPFGSTYQFSAKGTAFWTDQDPAKAGFTSGGVKTSGQLISSKSAPPGIGSSLLVREAYGMWNSDGAEMMPGCFVKE